jgi:hypothetical protein
MMLVSFGKVNGYSRAKRGKTRSRQRDKWHKKDAESLGEAGKMVEAVGQAREQEAEKGRGMQVFGGTQAQK